MSGHQGGPEDPGLPGSDQQVVQEGHEADHQQLRRAQGENGQVSLTILFVVAAMEVLEQLRLSLTLPLSPALSLSKAHTNHST